MNHQIVDFLVQTEGSILVASHRTPDGDTLGAGLGFYLWLKGLGKDVRTCCADPVPGLYRFLSGADCVINAPGDPPEVFCALDCASVERLGFADEQYLARAKTVINIDHHYTNTMYGTMNHVVENAGSTAEIVASMLFECGQTVTADIASCLYTGIVTDTGQFSFDYTRPESLRCAARLMECGAAFEDICKRVFRTRTLSKTQITAAALSTLRLYHDGRVAVMSVTQAALRATGSTPDECENIVNYAVEIDGAEVGVLLRETATGDWKVSLRSAGKTNVAAVAQSFGGGGHVKAAGCTLQGSLAEAEEKVVQAVTAAMGGL